MIDFTDQIDGVAVTHLSIDREAMSGNQIGFRAILADGRDGVYVATLDICEADMNGDGVLNILDFVEFQGKFMALDPAADCDANGAFNVLDFVCFQQLFVNGCPQ